MKHPWQLAILLAAGLNPCTGGSASELATGNPYQTLITRNVFGLAPALTVITNQAAEGPPPVKITANGIITVFGCAQVLFKTTPPAGGREPAYLLAEGQQQDNIAVLHINLAAALVTFSNHGILQDVSLPDVPAPASTPVIHHVPRPGAMGSSLPPYLGDGTGTPSQSPANHLTKEQQILMIEAQRAYYNSLGDPESRRLAQSLPPTSMTPADADAP